MSRELLVFAQHVRLLPRLARHNRQHFHFFQRQSFSRRRQIGQANADDDQQFILVDLRGMIDHPQHAILRRERLLEIRHAQPQRPLFNGVVRRNLKLNLLRVEHDSQYIGSGAKAHALAQRNGHDNQRNAKLMARQRPLISEWWRRGLTVDNRLSQLSLSQFQLRVGISQPLFKLLDAVAFEFELKFETLIFLFQTFALATNRSVGNSASGLAGRAGSIEYYHGGRAPSRVRIRKTNLSEWARPF